MFQTPDIVPYPLERSWLIPYSTIPPSQAPEGIHFP